MNLLLIGAGKWGTNYIKTCAQLQVLLDIGNRNNWQNLIESKKYQGVIIATPPDSHVDIAEYAFQHDLPCIIEKPLSLNLQECERLYKYNIPVIVNYIHLFADKYRNIKEHLNINSITQIVSKGCNFGPFRNYSALWDYAPHDLAMILDLVQEYPSEIIINNNTKDIGELYDIALQFSNFKSFTTVGNGSNYKIRELKVDYKTIVGCKSYQYLDNNPTPPLIRLIETFIKVINGEQDNRIGWELTKNINKILSTY